MKFERIIEGKDHLWAVRDMNKPKNELAALFQKWNDAEYLWDFFLENQNDLQEFFHIERISEAVEDTIDDAEQLERLILEIPYTDNLDELFLPLSSADMTIRELAREKARNWNRTGAKPYPSGTRQAQSVSPVSCQQWCIRFRQFYFNDRGGRIMKSKAVQFLEAHQSGERSTFVDDAKWRQENASWLRRSRRVAYAIMDYMQAGGLSRNDVAEKLGVSPQYVSKILSGKVNFSFKTISEIEECLGIEVFQAAAMES